MILKNYNLYLVVISLFISLNLLFAYTQDPLTRNDGKGWDGVEYYKITEQIINGDALTAESPFLYRIGTPFMVAMLSPNNIQLGFKIVNLVSNLITILLFTYWLNIFLRNNYIKLALIFFLLIQWHAPFRFTWFYNIYVDPVYVLISQTFLILIHKYREEPSLRLFLFICFISLVGVYFREMILVLSLSFIFVNNNVKTKIILDTVKEGNYLNLFKKMEFKLLIPSFLSIISLFVLYYELEPTNKYSFVVTGVTWLYRKSIIQYILAIFQAFGPIIIFLLFFWRDTFKHLRENQSQLFLLISIFTFGYIGGSDTERIIFWSFPVIFLMIGIVLENNQFIFRSKVFVLLFIIIQMISSRLFWIIPDYPPLKVSFAIPLYTLMSNNVNYLDLMSFHSSKLFSFVFFVQYIITTAITIIYLFRIKHKFELTK